MFDNICGSKEINIGLEMGIYEYLGIEAWNGGVRHREQLGGNYMKFSTKAKY